MNILLRELKLNLKAFLLWSIGLFVLLFAGVIKSTGIDTGGAELSELLAAMPPVVQAVLGTSGLDIGSFSGYYALMSQFAVLLSAVYAVHLGNSAVSREAVDMTYEFIFTKPRSRSYILSRKLLAAAVYLAAYVLLNFVFSFAAVQLIGLGSTQLPLLAIFAAQAAIVGLIFFAIGALCGAAATKTERGAQLGNFVVLTAFILGVIYEMTPGDQWLRLLSPFKFFLPTDMLLYQMDWRFIIYAAALALIGLVVAFRCFERRDLRAK